MRAALPLRLLFIHSPYIVSKSEYCRENKLELLDKKVQLHVNVLLLPLLNY